MGFFRRRLFVAAIGFPRNSILFSRHFLMEVGRALHYIFFRCHDDRASRADHIDRPMDCTLFLFLLLREIKKKIFVVFALPFHGHRMELSEDEF